MFHLLLLIPLKRFGATCVFLYICWFPCPCEWCIDGYLLFHLFYIYSGWRDEELHACFQCGINQKKDGYPAGPGFLGVWGKKSFVVYVYHVWTISHEQAGVWIPTTTIFTFTEYYLVLHTTWMAWFQRRKATSLELSTTYQSPAISWLQKSLTAISIQLTLLTRLSRHTGPRLVSTICTLYDHQQLTRQENRWNAETPKNLISWRAYTDMEYMEHTWSILVEDITRTP